MFAAAHVVADPMTACQVGVAEAIDWDATLRLRHEIWSHGLGVAESMDTAQRGMGIDPSAAMKLAQRTLAEDPRGGAGVLVGIATDELDDRETSLQKISDAYLRQLEVVESHGGRAVLMASRQLCAAANSREDYLQVYQRVIDASDGLVLHWLGDVFDPALKGYWGASDYDIGMSTVVDLIKANEAKIAGIKVSLLDPQYERRLRSEIPPSVSVFTGDDFNYAEMIAGDGLNHSHALLGAFAYLSRFASAAFDRLDNGDCEGFLRIMEPTQSLSRTVFERPTSYYKTGVAWLAYLTGRQDHFRMLAGLESGRSIEHLIRIIRHASDIGLFEDPEFSQRRAQSYFSAQGLI